MIRDHLVKKNFRGEKGFRWRGGDVSRIEALTDAVFAFSITLLVVSLEVPGSFDQLVQTMQGFLAFGITFAGIIGIWYAHYIYFRRYGLEDGRVVILNSMLLLVVIFYLYPLKFLANLLINHGILHRMFGVNIAVNVGMLDHQWPTLMLIYSFGFLAIFLIFVLLYWHAYNQGEALNLNAVESFATKSGIQAYSIVVLIAAISISISLIAPPDYLSLSGWIYFLVGPLMTIHGIYSGKKMQQLEEAMTSAEK